MYPTFAGPRRFSLCSFRKISSVSLWTQTAKPRSCSCMAETGFFTVAGQRYQMVIPSVVTLRTVKNALLKLAKTEDADFMLHPEKSVATISSSEAMDWQRRLRAMDECRRVADRYVSYNDCGGRT